MNAVRTPCKHARRLRIEHLEQRFALAAGVELREGTLHVSGNDEANTIDVSYAEENDQRVVRVTIDGAIHDVPANALSKLYARLGAGNDEWSSAGVNLPTIVLAGSGDDVVVSGNARDAIFGEYGDDTLSGNGGRDVLFGGAGDDDLFGGDGRDFLFGGVDDDVLDGGNDRDALIGDAGGDVLLVGNGTPADRVSGIQPADHVQLGADIPIPARAVFRDDTNEIFFFAERVELRRYYPPGVDGLFYRIQLNDELWGGEFNRAANVIHVRAYDVFIDDLLAEELTMLGWIDIVHV
jgi:Ca2+-binding RTX toxin-like protein